MTVAELEPYLDTDEVPNPDPVDAVLNPRLHRALRKWKIDLDDVTLPVALRNVVTSGQIVVATKAQVVAFIKRVLP
jgi:hypothetical protein